MDLGGTNLRVMLMDIVPGEELKTQQFNTRIPNWAMHGTGEQVSCHTFTKPLLNFSSDRGKKKVHRPNGSSKWTSGFVLKLRQVPFYYFLIIIIRHFKYRLEVFKSVAHSRGEEASFLFNGQGVPNLSRWDEEFR